MYALLRPRDRGREQRGKHYARDAYCGACVECQCFARLGGYNLS